MDTEKKLNTETKLIKRLDVFTLQEVSDLLEINEQTIRRYVREGKLKASKLKKLYFTKENIMEFINDNEIKKGEEV